MRVYAKGVWSSVSGKFIRMNNLYLYKAINSSHQKHETNEPNPIIGYTSKVKTFKNQTFLPLNLH